MIADELRGQYTLGYYPSQIDKPGESRYHSIKVTTQKGYSVRARTGYESAQ
jgi:hypothetical protein